MAKVLGVAKGYYWNIEQKKRPPFSKNNGVYEKLIVALDMTSEEISLMYKLLDKELLSVGKLSPDITDYLINNPEILNTIRIQAGGNYNE